MNLRSSSLVTPAPVVCRLIGPLLLLAALPMPQAYAAPRHDVEIPRSALERAALVPPARVSFRDGAVDRPTGVRRSQFGLAGPAFRDTPPRVALDYLARHRDEWGLRSSLDDLTLLGVRAGLGTQHARFQQMWHGLPVYGSQVVVSMDDASGEVRAITSDYVPNLSLLSDAATLPSEAAEAIAFQRVGAAHGLDQRVERTLEVFVDVVAPRLVWNVHFLAPDPLGEWEILVDANSGEVVSVRDLLFYASTGMPGTARVFHPDPRTHAGVALNAPGFVDGGDADTPQLTAARSDIPLFNLTVGALPGDPLVTRWQLVGPYARILDFPNATVADPADDVTTYDGFAADDFNHTRSQPAFEAAMIYAHMNLVQNWLQRLGFTLLQRSLRADPHALRSTSDPDNAFYSAFFDAFAFGAPLADVDLGEDAMVIVHEYGHAIQNDQVPGWGRWHEGRAMGEGFGDYLAGSYSAAISPFDRDWVSRWGLSEGRTTTGERRLANNKLYPDSLTGEEHDDGEVWSRSLWAIRFALGRFKTDQLVIQSHFYLTPGATFRDGALAMLQADADINGGANSALIEGAFQATHVLTPMPLEVSTLPEHQTKPALAFGGAPGTLPRWGRSLLLAWQTPGGSQASRLHPSGAIARQHEFALDDLQDPQVAFAPSQYYLGQTPYFHFLVVGSRVSGPETGISARLVRDTTAEVKGIFTVADEPGNEDSPAVGVSAEYSLIAWVLRDPQGHGALWRRVFRADSTFMGPAGPVLADPSVNDPAVAGGVDANGSPEFLVAWSQQELDGSRTNLRAARFDALGNPLGPGILLIANGVPGPLGSHHMTPAVAFDGRRFLIVWTHDNPTANSSATMGCVVDATTGVQGVPFVIDPGPNTRYPSVAFASRQYLVAWETHPLTPTLQNIRGVRLDTTFVAVDPSPLNLAVTAQQEHSPSVCATSATPGGPGGGFAVAWSRNTPAQLDGDILATWVPERLAPHLAPTPKTLGVNLGPQANRTASPGDTLIVNVPVSNPGQLIDAWALALVQSAAWNVAAPALVGLPAGDADSVRVRIVVPPGASIGARDTLTLAAVSFTDDTVRTATQFVVTVTAGLSVSTETPRFAFEPAAPNPFSSRVLLRFELARAGSIRLDVYDIRGGRVRTLVDGSMQPGPHAVEWDGRDVAGRRAPPGIYLAKLRAGERVLVRRVTRLD